MNNTLVTQVNNQTFHYKNDLRIIECYLNDEDLNSIKSCKNGNNSQKCKYKYIQ